MTETILFNEICQQPVVLSDLFSSEMVNSQKIADELSGRFDYIMIAARGTSDNAARYAQYLFGVCNHFQVGLAAPSLFSIYDSPPTLKRTLIISISQSGQSPDIISVVEEGRRQNCPTLAITNDPASPLAKAAELVLPLHAGSENAIAATKTYTSSLAALAVLSASFNKDQKSLSALQTLPDLLEKTIQSAMKKIQHVERYRYISRCDVIGRGFNYCTAFEASLKIKELTRVVAEPYSSADFRHGPIATVNQGFPVLLFAPTDPVLNDMLDLSTRLDEMRAEKIIISDNMELLKSAQLGFELPASIPAWLTPIVAILPGQLFAMRLAQEKGFDVDKPEGLTKVTYTL